jgi:hypothetical protein
VICASQLDSTFYKELIVATPSGSRRGLVFVPSINFSLRGLGIRTHLVLAVAIGVGAHQGWYVAHLALLDGGEWVACGEWFWGVHEIDHCM